MPAPPSTATTPSRPADDGVDKVVFTGNNLFDLGFSRTGSDLIVGAVKSGQTGFDGQVLVSGHYSGGAIGSVLIDTQFNGLYGTDLNQAKFVFTTNLASGVNNTTFTEVLLGSDKADTINGNGGFLDILAGNAGNDSLNGGAGDDRLSGGAGNDTIDGGAGINLADYGSAAAGIDVDLSQHKALVDGDGGQDTLNNIQNVRGSTFGDEITGDAGNNVIEGGKGDDIINGGRRHRSGRLQQCAQQGYGRPDGRHGHRRSQLGRRRHAVQYRARPGSQFSDSFLGNAGIFAEFVGSKGNDTIDGAGNGYASYYDSPGAVSASIASASGTASDGWGTTDSLKNLLGLTGSDFNDTLTGNGSANTLDGGKGDDLLTGGLGNDSIVGGLGTDTAVFSGKSVDYQITDIGGGLITVTDLNTGDGNDGTDTLSGIEALKFSDQTIDDANDPPVNSVPGAQSTNEDTALVFSGAKAITVSDVDADGSDLKVTLHVDHGSLDVVNAAGLVIGGDQSGDVTLTGSLSEINAGLNGMVYTPTLNYNGPDTLKITTDDLGHTGTGGSKTDTDSVAINVISVNDAPVATTASASGNEDAASIPITLTGTDVDGTIASVTLTSLPANGTLYSDAGLTTLAAISTPYAGASHTFYFVPNANFNGAPTFQFTVTDNQAASDATPATATITVNSVNDAPVATTASASGNEDTPIPIMLTGTDADGTIASITLTSLPANGTLYTDAGLTTLAAISTPYAGSSATFYFAPNANFNGAPTFQFTVTDNQGASDGLAGDRDDHRETRSTTLRSPRPHRPAATRMRRRSRSR
jgi:Ca2+-binding RTX toxin-like protein